MMPAAEVYFRKQLQLNKRTLTKYAQTFTINADQKHVRTVTMLFSLKQYTDFLEGAYSITSDL
jgi:hypothetical protein